MTSWPRDTLIHLLTEAADIEHNLLCSHLYAAFNLKTAKDGLSRKEVATVDVKNRVRGSRLPEDHFILAEVGDSVFRTYSREKGFWIESRLGFPTHVCPTLSLQNFSLSFCCERRLAAPSAANRAPT